VNECPIKEFKPGKGLRQSDPFAPFLFLIVAEGLAGAVRQEVHKDMLQSVKVGSKRVKVNMLHFADDTLFFCNDSSHNIMIIKSILSCFELALGLKVNFSKSRLGRMIVNHSHLRLYSYILNCEITKVLFKYLGLEMGDNH